MKRRFPTWRQVAGVVAVLLLLVSVSGNLIRGHFIANGNTYEAVLRIACLLGGTAIGGWLLLLPRVNRAARPAADQPAPDWLRRLLDATPHALKEIYQHDAVWTFIELTVYPAKYRTRVAETASLGQRVIDKKVSVEFSLPPIGTAMPDVPSVEFPASSTGTAVPDVPRHVYIPVLSPIKGEMLDNFRLTDATGNTLTDLSFDDATKLAAAGLLLLLGRAVDDNSEPSIAIPHQAGATEADGAVAVAVSGLNATLRNTALDLMCQIARRGYVEQAEADRRIDEALKPVARHLTETGLQDVRRYVSALSVAYPVIAVVPVESIVAGAVLLRYEQTVIPTSHHERGMGLFRTLLGIKPFQIAVPLTLAFDAASYHLKLSAPPTKYLDGQHFRCQRCKRDVRRDWQPTTTGCDERGCSHTSAGPLSNVRHVTPTDPHYRLRSRHGQDYAHLYMRGFGGDGGPRFRDLELFAEFKETPPGSRAVAVVTAFACTIILGIVGHLVSTGRAPDNSSDVPALLLALPAVVASWFGFATDGASLVGSSLLARVSQLITAVISFAAIGVYFTTHPWHVPFHIAIVGINSAVWALLFMVSTINFIHVAFRFMTKIHNYHMLLKRMPGDTGSANVGTTEEAP